MRDLFRRFSAALTVTALTGALVAGCSGGDDEFVPPTCDNGCIIAPVAVCNGESRITFSIPGECSDAGVCEFEAVSSPCAFGCESGECLPDPCLGVVCSVRPAPGCEEDVQVRYSTGTCQQGTCVYPESRFDCASNGQFCDNGACVDIDPCEGVDCSTTPAAACTPDARAVVRYGAGSCTSGQCTYSQVREECDGDGERCVDGACVPDPACESVDCSIPPANVCDNGRAVSFANGRCVAGACEFDRIEENCRVQDGICIDGACVPEPCSLTNCDDEPVDTCDGNTAVDFSGDSECRNDVCIYEAVRTDCTLRNETCQAGRCVNLCTAVSCSTPPGDRCDGDVATDFAAGGTCTAGNCSYPSVVTDCGALGLSCVEGRCLDSCGAVSCDQTEPDVCENDVVINLGVTPGTCSRGSCSYRRERALCADGTVCRDGECVATLSCDAVQPCPTLEDFCYGNVAVAFDSQPECTDGTCPLSVGRTETDCSALGATCRNGACVPPSVCDDVDCSVSPPSFCRGLIAVTYEPPGECVGGECEFTEVTTNCGLTDAVCLSGECIPSTLCDFVSCDSPPGSICEDSATIRQFTTPGSCDPSTGLCGAGAESELVICDSGEVCVSGLCIPVVQPGDLVITEIFATGSELFPNWQWVEVWNAGTFGIPVRTLSLSNGGGSVRNTADSRVVQPGAYVVLASSRGELPAGLAALWSPSSALLSTLEGTVELRVGDTIVDAVSYGGPGWPLVVSGSLAVRHSETSAVANDAASAWCASADTFGTGSRGSPGGANRTCAFDPCDGVECVEPRTAECRGTELFEFASPGICFAGSCAYLTEITDCAATGTICLDGACVADPCAGVACTQPEPPFCEEATAVVYSASGRCVRGECLYDEVRRDCSSDGLSCINGECVDLCSEVVCSNPESPSCEENVAIIPDSEGVCSFGECSYTRTEQDCSLDGLLCEGGACIDPCDGIQCVQPPFAFCDGAEAVWFGLSGVCIRGECEYSETRTNCDELGLTCSDGACIDLCEGVVCEQSQEPFCEGNTAITPDIQGTCTAGECSFGQENRDCSAEGLTCQEGQCVDLCETVICEQPEESFCDGDVAVTLDSFGTCTAGECSFGQVERDCAAEGLFCDFGRCVDGCEEVVCDLPPDSYCEGSVSVTFEEIGTCNAGECEYLQTLRDCSEEGAICLDGFCWFLNE